MKKKVLWRWRCNTLIVKFPTAAILTVAIVLSGCQVAKLVRYDDPADACYVYRKPLIETETIVGKSTVTGAVFGAVAGAIIGGIVGGGRGAALGATLGGVSGAGIGHAEGQAKLARTRADILAEINSRASGQASALGMSSGMIGQLTTCRRGRMDQVMQHYRAGLFTKDEAKVQLANIRETIAYDNELIAKVLGGAQARLQEYVAIGREHGIPEEQLVGQFGESDGSAYGPASEVQTFKAKSGSRVRSGPSTSTKIVGSLGAGQVIDVLGETDDGKWKRVDYNGTEAFVYAELLAPSLATDESTTLAQPRNQVQAVVQNTQKIRRAQQAHQALSGDIDKLSAELDA